MGLSDPCASDTWTSELASLARPFDGEHPCGESLEYDADYLDLEALAQGTPEVEYGSILTQATAPDWKEVARLALALSARSRDLRLAVYLTSAGLNLHGLRGLAAGLALVEALLDEHWEQVHPQLDPGDDNDPQLRVSVLASLCEAAGLLQALRETPLVEVVALGKVSLRDIELATGELGASPDQAALSLAMIEATFQEAGQETLQATLTLLEQAHQSSVHIENLLTERVGFASAIDLSALSNLLRRAVDNVRQRLPQQTVTAPMQASADAPQPLAASCGEIGNRDDVRQTLDRLCAYFAVHEPTSPVPLLLQRARKLLDLSFMELLQDLAPDGLAQMALVSGVRHDSGSDD
ncbi:type VI secretion system protein TssA [Pseudomonas sp. X10]